MFTGIVHHIGTIQDIKHSSRGAYLLLETKTSIKQIMLGSSVCVSGVCLTVAKKNGRKLWFDVMDETLQKTTIADWKKGDQVHVEPSLRMGDEVGGHFVFGHVDTTGEIKEITKLRNCRLLRVYLSKDMMKYIVPQGSVAIDGVSLTVAKVGKVDFMVSLVGYTLLHTTLKNLVKRDMVNIECDMLAKYVVKQRMQNRQSKQ